MNSDRPISDTGKQEGLAGEPAVVITERVTQAKTIRIAS